MYEDNGMENGRVLENLEKKENLETQKEENQECENRKTAEFSRLSIDE